MGAAVGLGVRVGAVAVSLRREGGLGMRLLAEGLGEGFAVVGPGRGDLTGSLGADWATGAVGRVDPTTKWIVRMTAVTLAAVQASHMIR
ncbi:hypothetical protein ACH4C6_29325 [Streptomyces sp. NPDC017943]|uniref:hypothetical protein n=1 Tax=Streptomyces sp. NPDC017943 TaxID=3365019 RepID=UPI0037AF6AA2